MVRVQLSPAWTVSQALWRGFPQITPPVLCCHQWKVWLKVAPAHPKKEPAWMRAEPKSPHPPTAPSFPRRTAAAAIPSTKCYKGRLSRIIVKTQTASFCRLKDLPWRDWVLFLPILKSLSKFLQIYNFSNLYYFKVHSIIYWLLH